MRIVRSLILPLFACTALVAVDMGKPTTLPATVYADGAKGLWIPSGYMGEAASITMKADSTDKPHSGATALQVIFAKGDGWGGVVWQSPANDWGALPGGFDLTGAKVLKFWARGATGGEKVKFGFGVIGADQAYPDTGKKELEVTLGTEWMEYTIDVAGLDLKRVKTGFMWVIGGQGAPVVFHLDDIRWE